MGPGYFDQGVWDEIISYINEARAKGTEQNSGDSISYSKKEDVAPFSAAEFKRIAGTIGTTIAGVESGKVIYGSYFTDLEDAVSSCKVAADACDLCNISCDAECNSCQLCVEANELCGRDEICFTQNCDDEPCDDNCPTFQCSEACRDRGCFQDACDNDNSYCCDSPSNDQVTTCAINGDTLFG